MTNTMRDEILKALSRQDELRRPIWTPYVPVKAKPCFTGTQKNLVVVDPRGREIAAGIWMFFGVQGTNKVNDNAVYELQTNGVFYVRDNGKTIGKIKMERTQRYDVPVARMYRMAA